jgi:HAT1-interacting factor 1
MASQVEISGNNVSATNWISREQAAEVPATDAFGAPKTAQSAIELAKRAFALKKYEEAVEYYSTALEFV